MILGVDGGYAACGWSVVEHHTGRVIACGVIVTTRDKRIAASTDRARRVAVVARTLADLAQAHGCTTIAAEQMLGHGAAAAVAANLLPWGALIGIATVLGVELLEVTAKEWQHAVCPEQKGKIDYGELAAAVKRFMKTQDGSGLLDVPAALRTHAIDSVGVALFAALATATRIIARRPTDLKRKDAA